MATYDQTWSLLAEALAEIEYRREEPPPIGWDRNPPNLVVLHKSDRFRLLVDEASNYAVLYIFTYNINTYHAGNPPAMRHTRHEFVVPVATYNKASWIRWVFDRIVSIEVHETTEWFFVNGVRIYSPHHGNGWDPYTLWYDGHPDEQAKAPGDD